MTMDQLEESFSSSQPGMPAATELFTNATQSTAIICKNSLLWEQEAAKFVCQLCKKTFYNINALQNHKNMQHDIIDDSSTSEGEVNSTYPVRNEQNANALCGIKFIPLRNLEEDDQTTQDGLTTRVFAEDTSYLIVKIEGDCLDGDSSRRSRTDGITRKNQPKSEKQPVDLRGPFTCTFPLALRPDLQCQQIFFNCCEYSLHYREEHTKRRKAALRCQVCEKRLDRDFYPSSNTVAAQLPTVSRYTFSCRLCGHTFPDSSKYDEHNRIVHAKMKPHQCAICFKRFTQQGGLQQHLRMHTGIRPFPCTFCPKTFTQKAGLDQHLRTHTKVKPFKCVVCSKCFSQSVHLRQHMRTHTNIQPFVCSLCGRKFKQSSHLNFHMRSHLMGDASVMALEQYAQAVQQQEQMEFLNLANLQPVQDGDTMYYAAELAAGPPAHQNPFAYQPQATNPENVLSL